MWKVQDGISSLSFTHIPVSGGAEESLFSSSAEFSLSLCRFLGSGDSLCELQCFSM